MIEDIRYSKTINWPLFLFYIVLTAVLLFYFDKAIAEDAKEPGAMTMAEDSIKAMGGMDGWKQVKAVRFDFRVEPQGAEARSVKHLWDRASNRDHIEQTKDGKVKVAWIDLATKKGAAWLDGKKLEGKDLTDAMDWAYGRWVNDTYWLIMPFKWMDSGVNVKKEADQNGMNVLHLSFNQVGLTPGDQYWVFMDPKTHLMQRWKFKLQGNDEGDFNWEEWGDFGPVKLSKTKSSADGKLKIRFDPLQVLDSADAAYFSQDLKLL